MSNVIPAHRALRLQVDLSADIQPTLDWIRRPGHPHIAGLISFIRTTSVQLRTCDGMPYDENVLELHGPRRFCTTCIATTTTTICYIFNHLMPTVAMGTAIKHPVPDRVKPSGLSVRVPGGQKLQMMA